LSRKESIVIKKEKKCKNCIFSKYLQGESILASGYICYKNPFKPKGKGLFGGCGDDKEKQM
jgi:hypothetical protein